MYIYVGVCNVNVYLCLYDCIEHLDVCNEDEHLAPVVPGGDHLAVVLPIKGGRPKVNQTHLIRKCYDILDLLSDVGGI
mgnify:CR=1 FL=1